MDDASIDELVKKYPLPKGIEDIDMNQADMAAALNTTLPTLTKWLALEDFPVIERGGLGKAYVLRLSQCYAWRQYQADVEDTRRRQSKDAIAKMQASFLNLEIEDPQAGMTAKQRKEIAEADYAHSRAGTMRRQLVRTEDMNDLLDNLMQIFREGLQVVPDRLERELSLEPEQVEVVKILSHDILVTMMERIEAAELKERDLVEIETSNQLTI